MPEIIKSLLLASRCDGILTGLWRVFGTLHELYLRPGLPSSSGSMVKLNGFVVPHENPKMFDKYIGIPNYEWKLICGMKEVIEKGDTVSIIGGGYGISSVYASLLTGDNGEVRTYEGASSMVDNIEQACKIHNARNVTVIHSIVSTAHSLRGRPGQASRADPAELPESDVLVLDCEGSEKEIIPNISFDPRAIIVETHGLYGAPPELVKNLLADKGLKIVFDEIMFPSEGISVVVGSRERLANG